MSKFCKEKGFSLVELLIAVFVFVVVFLSLIGLFYTSYFTVDKSRDLAVETAIAKDRM